MTEIYLMRHAQPDNTVHDTYNRPLTEKGMRDRMIAMEYLEDKGIDVVISSPYLRAMQTIELFAQRHGMLIEKALDMRERRVDSLWLSDEEMAVFSQKQWEDFEHRMTDGECLREVQERCMASLEDILKRYANRRVVIAGHGVAFSTIINHYCPEFGYEQQKHLLKLLPFVVHMKFFESELLSLELIDPLARKGAYRARPKNKEEIRLVKVQEQYSAMLTDYRQEFAEWEERLYGDAGDEVYMGVRESDGAQVGMLSICREPESELAGHIELSVRRSEREKGYAAEMLRQALEMCERKGARSVTLMCDIENTAAERTIVSCGGVLVNMIPCSTEKAQGGIKKRYRVEMGEF